MELGIKGKKVLLTGASQGIGKKAALAFAKEGCLVSLVARNENNLKQIVEEMGGKEKRHDYLSVDLMEDGAPKYAAETLFKKNGSYDILFNNVGGTLEIRSPFSSQEDWFKVLHFNVGIPIELNNYFVPMMQEKKWGRIVHLSSLTAYHLRGCAAYGPAKSYLNSYVRALGKGTCKEGIVVSALCIGTTAAEGSHWDENSFENKKAPEAFIKRRDDFIKHYQPMGKLATEEEIIPHILFWSSQQVTPFSTGSLVHIGEMELMGL